MANTVLLGIDLGTTVLKVCAFDGKTGAVLAQAAQHLKVRAYPDGGREQRPETVARAFKRSVGEVQDALGGRRHEIAGLGLAAQGGSSILVDRVTGKAHTPMILWNDGRTGAYRDRVASRVRPGYWRRHILNESTPAGLGRLLWLQETRPELFHDGNIHVGAGEYLFFRLTGVWRQDAGNAIQIGSYNAAKKRLDRNPFRLTGLPLAFVAPLRQGHETAPLSKGGAGWLDLPAGIPVAGPYIDQEAGYMAAMGVGGRPLQCSLGTAWVGNFVLPDTTSAWAPQQLAIPAPGGSGRLVILPLLAGNLTWEWALATCLDADTGRALQKAGAVFEKSLVPPEGLVAFPWFTQANPIHGTTQGAGAFFGVNPRTTRHDLLRAVVAGMTCELARVFKTVTANGAIDRVVLGGGSSNGSFFRAYLAALFAPLPVLWPCGDVGAARGAIYAFSSQAARTQTRRVRPPNKARVARIAHAYETYCTTLEGLYASPPGGDAFRIDGPTR